MGAASSRNKGGKSLAELDEGTDPNAALIKEQRELALSNVDKVGLAVVDLDKIDLAQEYASHILFAIHIEATQLPLSTQPK